MLELAERYLTRWQHAAEASMVEAQRAEEQLHPKVAPPAALHEVVPPPAEAVPSASHGVEPSARLDALLAQLPPAQASELRELLHLPAPAAPPPATGEAAPTPPWTLRSRAALMRQQGLLSSGPMAFGAVYDALQAAAAHALPAVDTASSRHKQLLSREVLMAWLAPLCAALLLAAALFFAGVRHGERAALASIAAAADMPRRN
jgi:hypothetical protein